MTYKPTEFENPETITSITAHYRTPTGRDGKKDFATVAAYLKWEKTVEAKGYDIDSIDTERERFVFDQTGSMSDDMIRAMCDEVNKIMSTPLLGKA